MRRAGGDGDRQRRRAVEVFWYIRRLSAAAVRLGALSGHSNLQELLTYVHPSAEEVSELY